LDRLRDLSPDEISSAIYSTVNLPKDRKLRDLLTEACQLWLLEEHNLWGSFWDGEELQCQSSRSQSSNSVEDDPVFNRVAPARLTSGQTRIISKRIKISIQL
jgi:hypothetical protein